MAPMPQAEEFDDEAPIEIENSFNQPANDNSKPLDFEIKKVEGDAKVHKEGNDLVMEFEDPDDEEDEEPFEGSLRTQGAATIPTTQQKRTQGRTSSRPTAKATASPQSSSTSPEPDITENTTPPEIEPTQFEEGNEDQSSTTTTPPTAPTPANDNGSTPTNEETSPLVDESAENALPQQDINSPLRTPPEVVPEANNEEAATETEPTTPPLVDEGEQLDIANSHPNPPTANEQPDEPPGEQAELNAAEQGAAASTMAQARQNQTSADQKNPDDEMVEDGLSRNPFVKIVATFFPSIGRLLGGKEKIAKKLERLKRARSLLMTAKEGAGLIDGIRVLIELVVATSETIVIPIFLLVCCLPVFIILYPLFGEHLGGKLSMAVAEVIKQVDTQITELTKKLSNNRKKAGKSAPSATPPTTPTPTA